MSIKKTISIAQKYLQSVKNVGIPVSKAYIFGSRINGKMHLGSDIDPLSLEVKKTGFILKNSS